MTWETAPVHGGTTALRKIVAVSLYGMAPNF